MTTITATTQRFISENPLYRWIQSFNFKTILDIGANTGQFARQFRYFFPEARICSFEPLPECFAELQQNFKGDINFQAFNFALGHQNSFAEIIPNTYSPTSSLLPMLETCKRNFPVVGELPKIRIELKRLDDLEAELNLELPLLVKIDVQGYEDRVIAGGAPVIQKADMLILEMSFLPLYENSILFDEMNERLRNLGFHFRGTFETIHSQTTGEVLQIDAIYCRNDRT
jgi:FkbM family methyltransferase